MKSVFDSAQTGGQDTRVCSFTDSAKFGAAVQSIQNTSDFEKRFHPRIEKATRVKEKNGTFQSFQDKIKKAEFVTTFYLPRNQELRRIAAKEQSDLRGTFAPPSEFKFRDENEENALGGKFTTKFHLPNNQTLRRLAAVDQAGLHDGLSLRHVRDEYDPRKDGKPEFLTRLPSECNKWGNHSYRLRVAQDQAAMRETWSNPAEFQFRDGVTRACTFHLVKSASRGVEMANRTRFPILSACERDSQNAANDDTPPLQRPDFRFLPRQPVSRKERSGLAGLRRSTDDASVRKRRLMKQRLGESMRAVKELRSISSVSFPGYGSSNVHSGRNSPTLSVSVVPSVEDTSEVEFTLSINTEPSQSTTTSL